MKINSSRPFRVALVNCAELPEPDVDFEPLAAALRGRGCQAEALAWDGSQSTNHFDVHVLRATWNYYHQPDQFLDWVQTTSQRSLLINPAAIVRWNANKKYLADLQQQNVPIVETVYFEQGSEAAAMADVAADRAWSRWVVKPVVSAASFCTRAFSRHEIGETVAFLAEQLPLRAMMVQPYMTSVETLGEKSIAWIDGQLTHAWTKKPRFAGSSESVLPDADISDADRQVAEAALRRVASQILYARIDLMYDASGRPRLSELELIEPSLYFDFHPPAAARFADAVVRQASQYHC